MRIEICGGLGSGKTTFALMLKSDILTPVLENFKSNPFWEPFYKNPGQFVFETEITFLLQHYHQIKVGGDMPLVCDFSFYQDLAFARMGLTGKRLSIFEATLKECIEEVGVPDLTICLQCAPNTLKERILKRGRKEEDNVTVEFLEMLNAAVYREFGTISPTQKTILIDSEKQNFELDGEVIQTLKMKISKSVLFTNGKAN
jgi:deoxyguanosine kinase